MTPSDKEKAFDAEVKKRLKVRTDIQKDTHAEIVRLLKLAQNNIEQTLSHQPSDYQRWSLPDLQFEISKILNELGEAGATKANTATGEAWQAGQNLLDKPLDAANESAIVSMLPRLDTQQLFAMRAFMTDRIKNIGVQAANKINTELALVVIGTQSPGDAVTAVRKILGDDSRKRSQTIVRTSLGQVFSTASQQRMQQAVDLGVPLQKEWRKSGKLHPRIGHNLAHGQTVPVHEPFYVPSSTGGAGTKMMHPHDPTAPAKEVINCGCTAVPKVDFSQPFPGGYQSTLKPTLQADQTNAEIYADAEAFAERKGISPGKGVPAQSTIVQFAKEAFAGKASVKRLEIGGTEKWHAIKEATGVDVSGYKTVLDASALKHIDKKHGVGKEKDKNQRAVTEADIASIPSILASYDNVTLSKTERGLDALKFVKKIDGEIFTYVAEVRGGRKQLAATTLHIKKKPRGGTMPD